MLELRFTPPGRPLAAVFVAAVALAFGVLASPASAQVDPELPSGSREGRAWGEAPPESTVDDPARIMANLGSGLGFRLTQPDGLGLDTLTPVNLHLGAAAFLPGRDIRHGVHLGVTTNLVDDGSLSLNTRAFNQYVLTPSYVLLVPLKYILGGTADMFHVQGRLGVPLVFGLTSTEQAGSTSTDFAFAPGVELAGAFHFKFLSGLGLYAEATVSMFFGVADNIFAMASVEAGVLWDYELLP